MTTSFPLYIQSHSFSSNDKNTPLFSYLKTFPMQANFPCSCALAKQLPAALLLLSLVASGLFLSSLLSPRSKTKEKLLKKLFMNKPEAMHSSCSNLLPRLGLLDCCFRLPCTSLLLFVYTSRCELLWTLQRGACRDLFRSSSSSLLEKESEPRERTTYFSYIKMSPQPAILSLPRECLLAVNLTQNKPTTTKFRPLLPATLVILPVIVKQFDFWWFITIIIYCDNPSRNQIFFDVVKCSFVVLALIGLIMQCNTFTQTVKIVCLKFLLDWSWYERHC